MKYRFKNLEWSDELVEFVGQRAVRLDRVAWRPTAVDVSFIAERHMCRVEMQAHTADFFVRATAESETFFAALDDCMDRLIKQMSRKKGRIQDHLVPENTHEGKIAFQESLAGVEDGDEAGDEKKWDQVG